MRLSLATVSLLAALASALPAPYEQTSISLTRLAKATWKSLAEGAFGWYDIAAVFDSVNDDVYAAPDKSVYQWLAANKDYSKITKLIKSDDDIVKILDGASHGLSFFAPDNAALPNPPHKKSLDDIRPEDPDVLAQLVAHADALTGNPKDDRRKRMFKAIIHNVLLYHILPYDITSTSLGANSTVPTALKARDGSYNGQHRRIKVEYTLLPPTIQLNKYAKVTKGDQQATNGVIHSVDHPLFPPLSILDIAHLVPSSLSTFTSAVQKVGLEDAIQYKWVRKSSDLKFQGTPVVTAFAPTNDAFNKLPEKLRLYLFSPFGERALRKLLSYHVVPEFIIHSEWVHNAKDNKPGHDDDVTAQGTELEFDFPFITALGKNYTLPVHIKKSTPALPVPGISYIDFAVQGVKVDISDLDFPARNGAVHVIPSVLDPRKAGKEDYSESDWEDWQEWLPIWGEQA